MSNDQQLPLTRVRGVGPTAASRMAQCGVNTVEQLANMSIAEFKMACPTLEKRAEAFVKGARRLLKRLDRVGAEQVADVPSSPRDRAVNDLAADSAPPTPGVEKEQATEPVETTEPPRLADEELIPEADTKRKKEKKKGKKQKDDPAVEASDGKKKKKRAAKNRKKDAGKSFEEKGKKEKKQKKANKDKKEKKDKKDKKEKKSK